MTIRRIGRKSSNTFVVRSCRVRQFRVSEVFHLHDVLDYFTKVLEDDLKAVVKPQYVDQIPKAVKGPDKTVEGLIKARLQMNNYDEILEVLGKDAFVVIDG